jgi:hypothetical protein
MAEPTGREDFLRVSYPSLHREVVSGEDGEVAWYEADFTTRPGGLWEDVCDDGSMQQGAELSVRRFEEGGRYEAFWMTDRDREAFGDALLAMQGYEWDVERVDEYVVECSTDSYTVLWREAEGDEDMVEHPYWVVAVSDEGGYATDPWSVPADGCC